MEKKIADAIALAQFSNLEASDVENFRNSIAPDFLPVLFWDLPAYVFHPPIPGGDFSQQLQHMIRQLWLDGFPATESVELIVQFGNFFSLWREAQGLAIRYRAARNADSISPTKVSRRGSHTPNFLRGLETIMMTPEQLTEREKEEAVRHATIPHAELAPFQVGILFLMMHPQRAVMCSRCGNRYVKLDKNQRYCSSECAREVRLKSKLGWWNKKGKKARSKEKSVRATKPVRSRRER
jgi:hypothetical protein